MLRTYNLRQVQRIIPNCIEDKVLQLVDCYKQVFTKRRHLSILSIWFFGVYVLDPSQGTVVEYTLKCSFDHGKVLCLRQCCFVTMNGPSSDFPTSTNRSKATIVNLSH
jgi:hypothetical protein